MRAPKRKSGPGMYPSKRGLIFLQGDEWRRSAAVAAALTGLIICPSSGLFAQEAAKNAFPSGSDSATARPLASGPQQSAETAPLAAEAAPNWDVMLETLMTSPAQKDLMSKVQRLLRQGDVAGAKQLLSSAVDIGTLAIVVADHVEDPALLTALDRLAIEGQGTSALPQASAESAKDPASANGAMAELKAAIEQERQRADAASQELSALQERLAAAQSREARTAELEDALRRAKEQAASSARELENARSQVTGMADKDARVAEFREAAKREKERADAALAKVAALQDQLSGAQAGTAEAAALKTAVRQEKERAAAAASELERVKTQLASLRPVESQALELKTSLDQEKERSAAYARDLRNAEEQLAALRTSEAKGVSVGRELEAARAELARLKAVETRTTQLKDALDREKERADAAQRELSTVSAQLAAARSAAKETHKEAAVEPSKVAPTGSDDLKRMVTAAMSDYVATTGLREALAQEKERTRSMARQLEAARNLPAMLGSRTEFTPAALLFRSPMLLTRIPDNADVGKTEDKPRKAPPRPAPSAALPPKSVEAPEPERKANVAPPQIKEQPKPEASKPAARIGKANAANDEKVVVRTESRRSPPPREIDRRPGIGALYLPRSLQPIEEEWEFQ